MILKKAQEEFENAIRINPEAGMWDVKMGGSNLQIKIYLANSEKGLEIIATSTEGKLLDSFVFEGNEYIVVR